MSGASLEQWINGIQVAVTSPVNVFALDVYTLVPVLVIWFGIFLALLTTACFSVVRMIAHFPRAVLKPEEFYQTASRENNSAENFRLPQTSSDPTVFLTVVVPAFNEASRLPGMLTEAVSTLKAWHLADSEKTWEILVVNDGSTDNTTPEALKVGAQVCDKSHQLKVCTLQQNRGKGGAVGHGMRYAAGKYIIFADADGASKFSDVKSLFTKLSGIQQDGRGVAIGSRAHMVTSDAVVKRSYVRNFLMHSLHTLLYVFGIRTIRDTQCGFKIFTRQAARDIFPYMHNEGWIFDVEVLILAERKKIKIVEVPISWHEVPGSKMELARDSIKMALDLVTIRFAYFFGIYNDGRGSKKFQKVD
ncbi:nucleotide-diphospho-sugar transferase [Lipomyces japonicus]|uniref:nucleotide-diphospho-sugar transferase n=1 Tax=Lipomyces japonicus TaxID=56871 RepID=UPI0034CFFD1D